MESTALAGCDRGVQCLGTAILGETAARSAAAHSVVDTETRVLRADPTPESDEVVRCQVKKSGQNAQH